MNKYENGQNEARLQNDFIYHPPLPDQIPRYAEIREKAYELALVINRNCPSSREQSLAFTYLDMVVMQANASIARNEV